MSGRAVIPVQPTRIVGSKLQTRFPLQASSVRVSSPGSKDSKGRQGHTARDDAAWRAFHGRKGVQTTRFLAGPPQRAPVDDTMCQTRASLPPTCLPPVCGLPAWLAFDSGGQH